MRILYPTVTTCLVGFCLLFIVACATDAPSESIAPSCYQLPVGTHLPRLFVNSGSLQMSSVQTSSQQVPEHHLDLWQHIEGDWVEAYRITTGTEWFINWADFPSAFEYNIQEDSSAFFAHWLEYSGKGTYDYDIWFSEGTRLNYKLHQDTVSAEHGFLSSAQLPDGDLQVTWLDGRYTKLGAGAGAENETEGHSHGGGAMTLRTMALSDLTSVELDHRVCDCCNTATVATDSLVMVAYRDRSEHEIRDIGYVVKRTGSTEWSTPKLVHADNYEISGCPVNGPALAANERGDIAIVWYTAPAGRAQILFSRYHSDTDAWEPPTLLDNDNPLGRVDLQLAEDGTAYATALTSTADESAAELTLWTIGQHIHNGDINRDILATTSPGRSSGFPKIALFQDKLYWARTVIGEKKADHHVEVCYRSL